MGSDPSASFDASERRLRSLLEATSACLFDVDSGGVVRYASAGFARVCPHDPVGVSVGSLFSTQSTAPLRTAIQTVMSTGSPQYLEAEFPGADGRNRAWNVTASPLPLSDGTNGVSVVIVEHSTRGDGRPSNPSDDFARIFDSEIVGIIFTDTSGVISDANDAFLNLVGRSREDLEKRRLNWADMTPSEWLDADRTALEEIAERGVCTPFEKEYTRSDGTRVPVVVAASVHTGRVNSGISIVMDRTDICLAQEQLRTSERRLRSLLATTSAFLYEIDRDGIIRYVNRTYPGLSATEVVGTPFASWFPEDLREHIGSLLHSAFDTGEVQTTEYTIPDNRGTNRSWTCELQPVSEPDNDPLVIMTAIETTRRVAAETAFRTAESNYRTISEDLPILVCRFATDGTIQYVNRAYCEFFDRTADGLVGSSFLELLPESDRSKVWANISGLSDTRPIQTHEHRVHRPDGTLAWQRWTNRAVLDPAGNVMAYQAVGEDITERRHAEEALRYSENLFRKVFDILPVGLWIAGSDGTLQQGNPEGVRIWGAEPHVPQEEYGVFTARRLPSGEEIAPDDWALAHTVNEGATITNELIEIDAFDGEKRVVLNSTAPVLDDAGVTVAAIVVNEDVTQLYRTERELRQNRQRFIDAQELARLGDFEWDIESNHVNWSEPMYRLLGYEMDELIGFETVQQKIHHPEDLERINQWLRSCLTADDGHTDRNEYRLVKKDGTIIDVSVVIRTSRDSRGHTKLFGVVNDISDVKRAEAEQEHLHRQLVQAQRLESVGRLAGGVAHDFNNMLSIIMGNIDLLEGREEDMKRVRSALQEIRAAAERSADLTRQLLAFARRQTIAPKVIRINDCVERTLKMLRRLIGEDIDLVWMPGGGVPTVKMDPAQIDQLLANLVINARDAIADIGKVTIETAVRTFDRAYCETHPDAMEGRYAMLAVSDDGCGMDAATLAHIFEPFFTSKGVGEGTGLGLATVYGIVRQNRGFITVYSEPGHGTTLRLYLPVHEEEGNADSEPSIIRPTAAPNREVVLLVEDDHAMLTMSQHMLDQLGYRVLAASKPSEALSIAADRSKRIDLLLTDVVMPGMNGAELARRVAEHHPEAIPVFMSGYTANVIAHHGVLDEGVHFLQKPFSLAQLSVALRDILQSDSPEARSRRN